MRDFRAIATLKPEAFPLSARIGRQLMSLICDHSQRVYAERRRALRDHTGFAVRDRDPVAAPPLAAT